MLYCMFTIGIFVLIASIRDERAPLTVEAVAISLEKFAGEGVNGVGLVPGRYARYVLVFGKTLLGFMITDLFTLNSYL